MKTRESGKMTDPAPPPDYLSDRGKAIWRELVPSRCDSIERQVALAEALVDLDRADAMRRIIDAEGGPLEKSRRSGLSRVHPAVRLEAEARRRFLAAWRALHLTDFRPGPW